MILLGKCICIGACLCGAAAFALYANHCLIETAKHVEDVTKCDIENATVIRENQDFSLRVHVPSHL